MFGRAGSCCGVPGDQGEAIAKLKLLPLNSFTEKKKYFCIVQSLLFRTFHLIWLKLSLKIKLNYM